MGAVLAAECERARAWASLALDGELSQVEEVLLRAHVGRCAACAEFESDLGALTHELRTAPPERPRGAVMPVCRRNSGIRALRLGAAVAAIVVAAALGSLAGSLSSRNLGQQSATSAHGLEQDALQFAELAPFKSQRLPDARWKHSSPV